MKLEINNTSLAYLLKNLPLECSINNNGMIIKLLLLNIVVIPNITKCTQDFPLEESCTQSQWDGNYYHKQWGETQNTYNEENSEVDDNVIS